MSCIDSSTRTRILAQISKIETQLTALDTAFTEAVANAEVESYKFDSGEGSQQVKRRDPNDIQKLIDKLESRLAYLYRRLDGKGLVNMNLRRRTRFSNSW